MTDWAGAWLAVSEHPLFGLGLTLGLYQLALALYEKTRWVFLQPMLVCVCLLSLVLWLLQIPYARYAASSELLTLLLGPATVALAVPLFLNLRRVRQLLLPTVVTLLVAGSVATVLGVLLAWWLGLESWLLLTLAPKSVTSPIAMLVAEQIGGVAALAAVFVIITGIIGVLLGPEFLRRCGITHPAAQGLALGLTSHAIGTARALQEGEECGGFSALAMSLMGVSTAVLLPLLVALWV
ncbi:LrgB family protein [Atopomonas sediminilitoris]|uniref:LrgB family protein n=1 Tax=Atopomonas sediminilitoris TaxID=2919919 RepID=UPI001F4E4850|nr:LrgB family protein [Atopomonas sediminilitoris]MCJ8170608.1 LrgB family protein [Atopomonas sediminilitoris]